MKISDQARDVLLAIMAEEGVKTITLVAVGESCCGPQFGLTLDAPGEDAIVEEINGVQIAINRDEKEFTEELSLEADSTPDGVRLYWESTCHQGCCEE